MATKKTTKAAPKKAAKPRAKKVIEKPVEIENTVVDGEVLGKGDFEEIPVKNDTVCVCSNWPLDHIFKVIDNSGNEVRIRINGNGHHLRGELSGILPIGAYGITANVPAEAWEQIKMRYKDDPRIKNGLIFATTPNKARREAAERKDLRNGLEPIDTKGTKTRKIEG